MRQLQGALWKGKLGGRSAEEKSPPYTPGQERLHGAEIFGLGSPGEWVAIPTAGLVKGQTIGLEHIQGQVGGGGPPLSL
jgi:hypothetical protein